MKKEDYFNLLYSDINKSKNNIKNVFFPYTAQ